jgi:asparagine synthase (glutamine-hydrolysing)
MCGICGVAALAGGDPPDHHLISDMAETLRHRGPDSGGVLVDGPVGLGARRLSIIDLARGDQPIANEDGSVHVVQNGEIYNFRELRRELRAAGHRFATDGDTEVLVHLYEEHGAAFAERLRGMFAIAIWDSRRHRLTLARDRFGIKPLVWSLSGGRLAFASELRALQRLPGFDRTLDEEAIEAYLAFNSIPAPLTIFRAARKLPAGHVLEWDGASEPQLSRYARPRPVAADAVRDEPEDVLAEELLARMRDSVRAHLVSDVPVGVLLSGGVDSATLTALASEISPNRVPTFSIGFEERSYNELERARKVARRFDTDHHELVVRPDAIELLPRIVGAFDEPFADASALPTYLVSELAAGSVKVAMSGEGADELFGGYYTYVADVLAPRTATVASWGRPLVERLPSSSRKVSLDYRLKRFVRAAQLPELERHHGWKEIFSADQRRRVRTNGVALWDPVEVLHDRFAETEGAERLARLQDVDLGVYLVDDLLVKVDRASMAHSLEARVPFLDVEVADLAHALPRSARVRGLSKKRLLRRAVSGVLPRDIVHGRKHGFTPPIAAWLRGEIKDFARDTLARDPLERQGVFDPAAVADVLDRHESGAEDLSRQIWGLLCFTSWVEGNSRQPEEVIA